ncbi:EpsG family protein [Chryseobacterium sp.]|uniref:EpsG family protein n=1 Tax=Chryseobacterium sp. TaxID=1871047 RepID=UPI0012A8CE6B|nr:EpsG family protein [Chryseobacterium sp.]QFG53740.1 EpsG family protein [Chryseobacterium sp.]
MSINLIIFPLIIFLGIFLGAADSPRNRKIFIYIVSAILILQTALRSLSVGSDTESYYIHYYDVMSMRWSQIWDEFVGRYFYRTSQDDIGYTIMQRFISAFTDSWPIFVFACNLIFFIPLGKLMYRYSSSMKQLVFAYVLYVSMFHIISLSGGRQLYAIGLTIFAFLYMDRGRYAWSIACMLLGAAIHMSCLLFVLPILLSRLNPKYLKTVHLVSMALVPVVLLFTNRIIILMGAAVGMDKYSDYGTEEVQGGATTFIGLLLLVSVFCYLAIKKEELVSKRSLANLYLMLPLFTVLGPLIYSNGSMIRISMYFHLYMMLLIPLAINRFFNGFERTVAYSLIIIVLIVLSLRGGGLIYHFYWQEPHLMYANE